MKPKEFEFETPVMVGNKQQGQYLITGKWWKHNAELEVDIHTVSYKHGHIMWHLIPLSFLMAKDLLQDIYDIAYGVCLKYSQQDDPHDTTTDNNQDHYLQTNNKLS